MKKHGVFLPKLLFIHYYFFFILSFRKLYFNK